MNNQLPPQDQAFVKAAAEFLEQPSLLLKLASLAGTPLRLGAEQLPGWFRRVASRSLAASMHGAALTTGRAPGNGEISRWMHSALAAGAGGAGGWFGLPALAVELPVTTLIMMHAIAAVARDHGEDPRQPAVRLECLGVLSHGGPRPDDDDLDSAYYSSRVAVASLMRQSADYLAKVSARQFSRDLASGSAPHVARLIALAGSRFNVVITHKVAAQAVPVIGAAAGCAINAAFTDHFIQVARWHFGIRRLERLHGEEAVRAAYQQAVALAG